MRALWTDWSVGEVRALSGALGPRGQAENRVPVIVEFVAAVGQVEDRRGRTAGSSISTSTPSRITGGGLVDITDHPASIGDGGMRVCPWMSPISIPTSSM